jgi:RecB family endonuclease NucS
MLMLMAVTLFYTEEEERMDKMLKKMEDANRSQLETLRGQQHDIHQLTNALVGQTAEIIKSRVEKAISEYMASSENVDKAIANEISSKIMKGLREAYSDKR